MATIINCGGGTMTNCPFPIGYGGFFQTDPTSIYAGTTWEQKKDVFILAAGDTYSAGSTGGEAGHTLTVDEMPKHAHDVKTLVSKSDGNNANALKTFSRSAFTQEWWDAYDESNVPGAYNSVRMAETGDSQPHNNMPPYYTMPFWIRTA